MLIDDWRKSEEEDILLLLCIYLLTYLSSYEVLVSVEANDCGFGIASLFL